MTICIPQGDRGARQGAGLVKTIPRDKKGLQKQFVCKGKWGSCCGDGAELHRITPELQTGLHLFFLIFQYFFKICNSVILKTV